jgi:hypothetical protein
LFDDEEELRLEVAKARLHRISVREAAGEDAAEEADIFDDVTGEILLRLGDVTRRLYEHL